ncbi:efflux RND transporter periplasmic adaptor subunit [Rhizobium sp. SGZ-381]|uniref:efflux RND transporter periplasmic adaptor subunit n=1 Tax=Rhizobium sp. SGZ-381 TaxID=3342800 RepID=UPI00366A6634
MKTAPSSLSALLLAATFLTGCQKEEASQPEPPRPVLSVVAEEQPAAELALPGTVEARITTDFSFRVLGRIVARNVHVGDLVKKGDVLAAIDPLALELAVKSSQSDLVNSQAQLANALTTEQRQKTLYEKQSGAKSAFETAELDRKTAEASVDKAQANLDKAKEQLSYARLLAEFDGVVTSTAAEVGQVVSAGQTVATVARPDIKDAVIDVPETVADKVRPGSAFDVALQLDPSVHAKGVVREIAPEADDATRTRRTKLSLTDPPAALRLGSVITATALDKDGASIRLPSSAIKMDGTRALVWVVSEAEKKVTSRAVTLASPPQPGGMVTVAEGLKPGERIVTAGVHKLQEGQTVRLDQEMTK